MSGPDAYDAALSALRRHVADLGVYLGTWAHRDDAEAQPDVRRAASHAVNAVDAALAELHGVRVRLVGEIRASDDAAAARVDELLWRIGQQQDQEGETR